MFKLNLFKQRGYYEDIFSIIVVLSCVYTFKETENTVCVISTCNNSRTSTVLTLFYRSLAIGCMASRIAIVYKNTNAVLSTYVTKINAYEVQYPLSGDKKNLRRKLIVAVAVINALSILPVNLYRFFLLYKFFHSVMLIIFFALTYTQNITMCATEMEFVKHCVRLCQQFQRINEDLSVLKSETIVTNGYPLTLKPNGRNNKSRSCGSFSRSGYDSMVESDLSVNVIERIKLRHKYISNAVRDLNDLFALQLGTSLCILFFMNVTSIYEFMSDIPTMARPSIFHYIWLFQYSFRFCTIVTTTHLTTKEVRTIISVAITVHYSNNPIRIL